MLRNRSLSSIYVHSRGFTLAEVLITLGIIGVVAAIMIPSLIADSQKKEYVAAVKKNYSMLQQAINLYKADNGNDIGALFPDGEDSNYSMEQLAPYLKVVKKCTTSQSCWSQPIKYLNTRNDGYGNFVYGEPNYGGVSSLYAKLILADGTRIAIRNNAANRTTSVQCDNQRDADGNFTFDIDGNLIPTYCVFSNYGFIYVDTNGAKGPNRYGYDNWEYRVYDSKITGCSWSSYTGCVETAVMKDSITLPIRQ